MVKRADSRPGTLAAAGRGLARRLAARFAGVLGAALLQARPGGLASGPAAAARSIIRKRPGPARDAARLAAVAWLLRQPDFVFALALNGSLPRGAPAALAARFDAERQGETGTAQRVHRSTFFRARDEAAQVVLSQLGGGGPASRLARCASLVARGAIGALASLAATLAPAAPVAARRRGPAVRQRYAAIMRAGMGSWTGRLVFYDTGTVLVNGAEWHIGVAINCAGGVWVKVVPPMCGPAGATYTAADFRTVLEALRGAVRRSGALALGAEQFTATQATAVLGLACRLDAGHPQGLPDSAPPAFALLLDGAPQHTAAAAREAAARLGVVLLLTPAGSPDLNPADAVIGAFRKLAAARPMPGPLTAAAVEAELCARFAAAGGARLVADAYAFFAPHLDAVAAGGGGGNAAPCLRL